jgi:hypothetical protein
MTVDWMPGTEAVPEGVTALAEFMSPDQSSPGWTVYRRWPGREHPPADGGDEISGNWWPRAPGRCTRWLLLGMEGQSPVSAADQPTVDWRPGTEEIPVGAVVVALVESDGVRYWHMFWRLPEGVWTSAMMTWWPEEGRCIRWLLLEMQDQNWPSMEPAD